MTYITKESALQAISDYTGGAVDKTVAKEIIEGLTEVQQSLTQMDQELNPTCMDCISRQAAIDVLHVCLPGIPLKRLNEILSAVPSAQPEPQWIPVSERLPEANGRYLVTRGLNACGAMWNRVYIINYSDLMGLKSERIWWDGNVGKSDFERIDDVIAWKPLDEPWRVEANG